MWGKPRYQRLNPTTLTFGQVLQTLVPWLGLALAIAAVGMAIQAMIWFNDGFATPSIRTGMLNVTGKANVTEATIDSLRSTMIGMIPQEHIGSEEISCTHNLHHLTTNTHHNMTLPADLSACVGKTMTICSMSGQADLVMLTGSLNWQTPKGTARVKYARFNATSPCCFTFQVTSASSLSLLDTPKCVSFSPSVFGGWWHDMVTAWYDLFEADSLPYQFFDDKDFPTLVSYGYAFANTVVKELTFLDTDPSLLEGGARKIVDWSVVTEDHIALFDDFYIPSHRYWQAKTGHSLGSRYNLDDPTWSMIYTAQYLVPIENLPVVPISAESGSEPAHLNPDIPRNAFYYMSEMLLEGPFQGQSFPSVNDDMFIGFSQARTLRDTILNSGMTHTSTIHKVFRTSLASDPFTRIRLTSYHHAVYPANITISGFTGDWAVMNGLHEVVAAGTSNLPFNNPLTRDITPGNPDLSSHHYDVMIFFNSSDLPANGDGVATYTGTPTLEVKYGPFLNPSTEPWAATVAAFAYWTLSVYGELEHTSMRMWQRPELSAGFSGPFPPMHAHQTATTLAADLLADSAYASRVRVASLEGEKPTGMYRNEPLTLMHMHLFGADIDRSVDTRQHSFDVNDRFGVRPDLGITPTGSYPYSTIDLNDKWLYHISQENYVLNVSYAAWRTVGTSRTGPLNLVYQANYPGGEGDYFHWIPIPLGEDPPFPYTRLNNIGVSAFDEPLDPITARLATIGPNFGMINPDYTGGVRIGYIRHHNWGMFDWFYDGSSRQFADPDILGTPLETRGMLFSEWAMIMDYLQTTLGCTEIIIDHRRTFGGAPAIGYAHREFFGSDDYFVQYAARIPLRNGGDIDFRSSGVNFDPALVPYLDQTEKIFPSLVAQYRPNSHFSNGNIVLLHSTQSFSACQYYLESWFGQNDNKQLGNNTQVKVFGDIAGRNQGYSRSDVPLAPTSFATSIFRTPSGNPLPYLQIHTGDAGLQVFRHDNVTCYSALPPYLVPDAAPSLTGLSGGNALPNDRETILYPDLGYKTNSRPRLPGDLRPQQPDPNDRWTWRDAWLEQAIEELSGGAKKKRKIIRRKSKPYKPAPAPILGKTQRKKIDQRNIKRNHLCPQGSTSLQPASGHVKSPLISLNTVLAHQNPQYRVNITGTLMHMYQEEMEAGGLCIDEYGVLMVTPTCKQLPGIVIDRSRP